MHHLDRFATYLLWFLMMSALSIILWRVRRSRNAAPGQLSGLFLLSVAIATVLASLTTATRGHPFSFLQWLSLALAIVGYRLLMPTS
jgi:phosphoglycerol transferase MdoB-like AlkP superfamily enzyme